MLTWLTWRIYVLRPSTIILIGLLLIPLWAFLPSRRKMPRWWKTVNRLIFLFSVMGTVYITILSRMPGSYGIALTPFHSFVEAKIQPELYRSMLMNIFLFLPYGLSLPYALAERTPCKLLITILSAGVFTAIIEAAQYYLQLGRCETDDVIMAVIGAGLGSLSYSLCARWKQKTPDDRRDGTATWHH